ncbi:MAG: RNA polymerase sporulation sigma factor SigF [Clostridiaceae bacterium]|nr:RNA polymerase sporulation sigma factor SigF [Clostridiaceae bacterium]
MSNPVDINSSDLIEKAKNGDKEAQSIMVEKNIGLVWSIVKRFQNRGYETEDLFQIGCMGLLKAINKFDASFNVRFSTYAVPMIIGEIKRFIRDDGLIKVSRSLKETSNKVKLTKEIIFKELGREPSVAEIAERLEITPEEVVMALEATNTPEYLYNSISEGDSAPVMLIDRVDSEAYPSESEIIDKITLMEMLNTLEPRERQIIILRYFKEKTQAQIAKMLGISQVQVSRLEKKILKELRKKIKA